MFAAELGSRRAAATLLASAVAGDLIVEAIAKRRNWHRGKLEVHIETLVDFVSFVWAPVALVLYGPTPAYLVGLSAVFVGAGVFRLVRFNVEGFVRGGYRGMPVTYNGAAFPLALLAASSFDALSDEVAFASVLILCTVLMPSGAFVVPRIRP